MPTAIADSRIEIGATLKRFSLSGVLWRYHLIVLLLIAAIWMARSPYSASNSSAG